MTNRPLIYQNNALQEIKKASPTPP